jgi:hypothetical protein
MANEATVKRSIKPVTLTIKVKASKVNENGTLSGLEIVSISSDNPAVNAKDNLYLTTPNFGHSGQMLARVNSLEGLALIESPAKADKPAKAKLF